MSAPSRAKTKITVSIPVKVGGYTGQRDEWQEFERDHVVTRNPDGTVSLQESGSGRSKITFDPEALTEALGILRQQRPEEFTAKEIIDAVTKAERPRHSGKPLDGGLLPPFEPRRPLG